MIPLKEAREDWSYLLSMIEFKTNTIYCGDCRDVLRKFPEESVDLIYLDPPFSSDRIYNIVFGTNYERRAFEDRWKGGVSYYTQYMKERLLLCKRVLKETGSLYLHCDWHASHHLRMAMDDVFGYNNFRNEIIWTYTRPGTKHQGQFPRTHDTILWYSNSNRWTFNVNDIRIPYAESTIQRGSYSVRRSKVTKGIDKRVLPVKGKCPEDWWHISMIQGNARERLGYPTQKPEKLLERIILASSKPNDLVLDPMCGCGTTIAVAHKQGRKWIGIDIAPLACETMQRRMRNSELMGSYATNAEIIGLPKTEEDLWELSPFEFENWVCDVLFATQSRKSKDMGIDGFTLLGTIPVQAKKKKRAGRPDVDSFETAIKRVNKDKGIMVAFGFSKDAYEETARVELENGLKIELRSVEDLLKL